MNNLGCFIFFYKYHQGNALFLENEEHMFDMLLNN